MYSLREHEEVQQRTFNKWRYFSFLPISIIILFSCGIYYLLSRLEQLDPIYLFLGIFQASALLLLQIVLMISILTKAKTIILGSIVMSLIVSIGCIVFYVLLQLAMAFQLFQGQMGLTPPHTKEWYSIKQIFDAGLVIQEILVLLSCFVAYKAKTQISDLSKNGSGFFETTPSFLGSGSSENYHQLHTNTIQTEDVKESTHNSPEVDNKGLSWTKKFIPLTQRNPTNQSKSPDSSLGLGMHQAASYTPATSKMMHARADLEIASQDDLCSSSVNSRKYS